MLNGFIILFTKFRNRSIGIGKRLKISDILTVLRFVFNKRFSLFKLLGNIELTALCKLSAAAL